MDQREICYNTVDMKRLLRFALPALLVLAPLAVSAQIKLLPPCTANGDCGVSDILIVLVNGAEYLLGISGAVALIMFVYGGFTFILAAGDKTKVGDAIKILKNAVIGIAIIFLSGILVRFATQTLTGGASAVPTIGENCDPGTQKSVPPTGAKGLWISIPPGLDAQGKLIPEGLKCLPKLKGCDALKAELEKRNRKDPYSCKPIQNAQSCVRGLCSEGGADVACCI